MSEREPRPSFPLGDSEAEAAPVSYLYSEQNPLQAPEAIESPQGFFAFYTDKGIGYSKPDNQDAILVNPHFEGMVVADGMGGHADGGKAAQLTTLAFNQALEKRIPFKEAHLQAENILAKSLSDPNGGACYIAAYRENTTLHVAQAGDVRLIKISKDGEITGITGDESHGSTVLNFVSGTPSGTKTTLRNYKLSLGDRILIMSDGVTGNFVDNKAIASAVHGLPALEAVAKVRNNVLEKMHKRSVGELSKKEAKCDNFSILIYEPKF